MAKPLLAPSVFECEICNEKFDSGGRRPVCLMCGHTFCNDCVTLLETAEDGKECPRCRQPVTQPVDELPINYALIPSEVKFAPPTPVDRCENHGCELDYFCTDCANIVCRKCAKQFHAGHKVEFMDDIADKDELVMSLTDELQCKMKRRVDRLQESLAISEKILIAIDAMQVGHGDVLQCKNMLIAQQQTVDQDLEAWNAAGLQSVEEKRKLSKNLCRYWKDCEYLIPDYRSLQPLLGRLIDNAKSVENLTKHFRTILGEDLSLKASRPLPSRITIVPTPSPMSAVSLSSPKTAMSPRSLKAAMSENLLKSTMSPRSLKAAMPENLLKSTMSLSLPKATIPLPSSKSTMSRSLSKSVMPTPFLESTLSPPLPKCTISLSSPKSMMPQPSPKATMSAFSSRSGRSLFLPRFSVPPPFPKSSMHLSTLKSTWPPPSLPRTMPSMKTQMPPSQEARVPQYSSDYTNQTPASRAYVCTDYETRRKM